MSRATNTLVTRTTASDPAPVLDASRCVVHEIDPLLAIPRVQTMEDVVDRSVRRLVVGRGILLGLMGVLLGAGLAYLLTSAIQALLTKVTPTDPTVFTLAGLALLVVTVLAGYFPARQASRTDPMIALRAE